MFCVYTKPAKESEKCGVYHATGQPKKKEESTTFHLLVKIVKTITFCL